MLTCLILCCFQNGLLQVKYFLSKILWNPNVNVNFWGKLNLFKLRLFLLIAFSSFFIQHNFVIQIKNLKFIYSCKIDSWESILIVTFLGEPLFWHKKTFKVFCKSLSKKLLKKKKCCIDQELHLEKSKRKLLKSLINSLILLKKTVWFLTWQKFISDFIEFFMKHLNWISLYFQ